MGNRAVITTKKNYENNGVGVYLHWNGGRDSIEAFLEYAKRKGVRGVESDGAYFWARFSQIIANYFGGTLSLGVDTVNKLDCNGDNGVYFINDDFEIVGRKNFSGHEQQEYALEEMIDNIDSAQPEQLKTEYKGYIIQRKGDYDFIIYKNGDCVEVLSSLEKAKNKIDLLEMDNDSFKELVLKKYSPEEIMNDFNEWASEHNLWTDAIMNFEQMKEYLSNEDIDEIAKQLKDLKQDEHSYYTLDGYLNIIEIGDQFEAVERCFDYDFIDYLKDKNEEV